MSATPTDDARPMIAAPTNRAGRGLGSAARTGTGAAYQTGDQTAPTPLRDDPALAVPQEELS